MNPKDSQSGGKKKKKKNKSIDSSKIKKIDFSKTKKPVIVFFHMDHCGWCDQMKPDWEDFKEKSPINCESIEANDLSKHNIIESIDSFPTIRLYNKGSIHKFENRERTSSELLKFVKEILGDEIDGAIHMQAGGQKDPFKYIYENNKQYSIFTKKGKKILKNYILSYNQIKKGGRGCADTPKPTNEPNSCSGMLPIKTSRLFGSYDNEGGS